MLIVLFYCIARDSNGGTLRLPSLRSPFGPREASVVSRLRRKWATETICDTRNIWKKAERKKTHQETSDEVVFVAKKIKNAWLIRSISLKWHQLWASVRLRFCTRLYKSRKHSTNLSKRPHFDPHFCLSSFSMFMEPFWTNAMHFRYCECTLYWASLWSRGVDGDLVSRYTRKIGFLKIVLLYIYICNYDKSYIMCMYIYIHICK